MGKPGESDRTRRVRRFVFFDSEERYREDSDLVDVKKEAYDVDFDEILGKWWDELCSRFRGMVKKVLGRKKA